MIDDGPFARLCIYRAVKRFELDLSRWPRPPDRGGENWDTYWEYRTTEIISTVGMLIRKLIEADKVSVQVQGIRLEVECALLRGDRVPTKINYPHLDRFYRVEDPRSVQISINEICNCLVHSFVLVPEFSYSSLKGLVLERLFVASERGRYWGVYIFRWKWFVDQFVWLLCTDDVVSQSSRHLPDGDSLYLPSNRLSVPANELARLYCGISKNHRRRYNEFMEKFIDAYGGGSTDWPMRV
jgi:hypothetical protein